MFLWAGRSYQEEVWRTNAQKATTHLKGSLLIFFSRYPKIDEIGVGEQNQIIST
jgi:hypothetical protein